MIIGFLGKGGSGKTTLATLLVKRAQQKAKKVLAVDADHNMDFTYNLLKAENDTFFGTSINHLKEIIGLDQSDNFRLTFLKGVADKFTTSDSYVSSYATKVDDTLKVMTAGPHTEELWSGKGCSHALFTPLKIFFPYLNLEKEELVVVDEKAGMDPVGTMVPAGFDLAVVVSEPTIHSLKTARQIIQGLNRYNTPYILVANKITKDEDKEIFKSSIYEEPSLYFTHDIKNINLLENEISEDDKEKLDKLLEIASKYAVSQEEREKRCVGYWLGLNGKSQS